MARSIEQGGILIQSREDIAGIRGRAERKFAELLLRKPHLELTYEPRPFEHTNGDGRQEGTLPDFYVLNTRTGRGIYVEITVASCRNGGDPKERQRRVMQAVGEPYTVLYWENLVNIQRKHRINFFDRKRVR